MTESRQFEQGKEQKPVISEAAGRQAGVGPKNGREKGLVKGNVWSTA